MAQHDGVIDNGPGLAVRTDINAALQALLSQNSGPIEPTTMYAGMLWLDTSVTPDGLLRQRNLANTAWITPTTRPAIYGDIVVIKVSSTTSYSKPAGLRFLQVELWGGGGGSGGAAATGAGLCSASGGGGGGAYVRKLYKASDLATSEPLAIGAGGARGTSGTGDGGNAGASTFKALSAGGGGGSAAGVAAGTFFLHSNRGGGAAATGGDVNVNGISGQQSIINVTTTAGARVLQGYGGQCNMSGGMFFGATVTGQGTAADVTAIGLGANGVANCASQSAQTGAAGGPGQAILTEYY